MSDQEDFDRWISALTAGVRRNIKQVTPESLGHPCLYRIDRKAPKEFIPYLPEKRLRDEDMTVPRVSTAKHVLGCLFGIGVTMYDVIDGTEKVVSKYTGYRGGYELQEIEFERAVEPNTNLVGDQLTSDEVWLVAYNKQTSKYKFKRIGELFCSQLTHTPVFGSMPRVEVTWLLRHDSKTPVVIGKGLQKVEAGCWRIVQTVSQKDGKRVEEVLIGQMSDADYVKAKHLQAETLNLSLRSAGLEQPLANSAALRWATSTRQG